MLALLLCLSLSHAQDTALDEPVVDDAKVVGPVVEGQAIEVVDGDDRWTFRVERRYWLIRDDALRTALANARAVPQLERALTECRDAAIECGVSSATAWATMKEQFDTDTVQMDSLLQQTATLTVDLRVAEADRDRFRRQRNVAYIVVGGIAAAVLVGTGVGLGVSLSTP